MIKYRDGYKYQLATAYRVKITIKPKELIDTEFIRLTKGGLLTIKKGYASDGPSGPTLDTKTFMRGAFVHDALYQLMRMKKLPLKCRREADLILQRMCRQDGMSKIRAWYVYESVKNFAKGSALPKNRKRIYTAP